MGAFWGVLNSVLRLLHVSIGLNVEIIRRKGVCRNCPEEHETQSMVDGHIQTVARRNEAIVLFSLITIDNFTVKTDSEGRLCLNDLHKVAGGEKRHAPAYFIDRVELDELRFELKKANTGIPVVKTTAGRYGGTFVCREIVYAYAMWIRPQFHLKAIGAQITNRVVNACGK